MFTFGYRDTLATFHLIISGSPTATDGVYHPLFKRLHDSRIPSEAVIFLVAKSLCKRDQLMVGIEIMSFLLSVMFKHERQEDSIIVRCCNNAHVLIQQYHAAAFPFVFR